MILRFALVFYCSAICVMAQAPPIKGKISGGFQAPTTVDPQGRRSVVKGTDATPQGNNIYLITDPRVTSYNPDDSPEMFISASRCLLDLKSNLAWSDGSLAVKTADNRFALEGQAWRWDPRSSELRISNHVSAVVQKAVLASGLTNRATSAAVGGTTNQPVTITSERFEQEGDNATFLGNVLVQDGADTLRCDRLNLRFVKPGGIQRVEAVQNVELTQGSTKVKSGLAIYDLKEGTLAITRNPVWVADRREGSAETLLLNRSNNTLLAQGKVFMKLPLTNVVSEATNTLAGDSKSPAATNRYVEIYSDRFLYENATSNTPPRAVYTDNVRAIHQEAAIRCNELTAGFDGEQRLNALYARGAVEIESKGGRATGETADYSVADEKFSLLGEPRWQMDENSGRSHTLVFFPKTGEILALGNVEMQLPVQSAGTFLPSFEQTNSLPTTNSPLRIRADTFSHQENISVFHDGVRAEDSRGTIECRLLTVVSGASNQLQRIIAEHQVVITQKDMVATGDRAEYDVRTGLVNLTGDPVLRGPDKSLRSDAFVIDRGANTFSVAPGKYRIELRVKKNSKRTSKL